VALLEQVYRDTPESPEAAVRYGALLIEAGRVEDGYAVLEDMPFAHMNDRDLEVLQGMWAELGEYARVADVVEKRIAQGAKDPQLYATLAAVYQEQGDVARARAALEQGAAAYPAYAVEFEQLLAQVE
jgi:predicted Zn-dependent protease